MQTGYNDVIACFHPVNDAHCGIQLQSIQLNSCHCLPLIKSQCLSKSIWWNAAIRVIEPVQNGTDQMACNYLITLHQNKSSEINDKHSVCLPVFLVCSSSFLFLFFCGLLYIHCGGDTLRHNLWKLLSEKTSRRQDFVHVPIGHIKSAGKESTLSPKGNQ